MLFIIYLYIPINLARKHKESFFITFIVLLLLHFQAESMLSTVKGVIFVSYFLSLFIYDSSTINKLESP